MSMLTRLDALLATDGPAAIVLKQPMMPVEGDDGVVFPATYAAGSNFAGGYNIDTDAHGRTVALIDSVGAQANRIEPVFGMEPYSRLVPQVFVTAGDKRVSILETGHRAGDALVRCSSLQGELQAAFKSLLGGDATLLARIAPTSLVFGVWDSRDTQAKVPRVIASTIRAFDVRKLTRSAQFNPALDYVGEKLLDEPADSATKDKHSQRGFNHVPSTGTHGGIIADGGILRTATLNLAAIRQLHAGGDHAQSVALRRYILGLSLVAFTLTPSGYLRQGCNLVVNPGQPSEFVEVQPNGVRTPCTITHMMALEYATEAAAAFGVGESRTVPFDKDKAQSDLKDEGETKSKGKKGK
jgi:CRISPR-associated protein Csb1